MKIGLDVDDVIADLHTAWVAAINTKYGTTYTIEDMKQWHFYKDWGMQESQAYGELVPDLYKQVKPVEGALDVVNELRRLGHEIVYITSCGTPEMWFAKANWLTLNKFLLPRDQAFPVGEWAHYKTKAQVGDAHAVPLLVDDCVENCENWRGYALLVTRPHNRNVMYTGKRLRNFNQLVSEVKYMKLATAPGQIIEYKGGQLPPSPMITVDEKPTNPKDAVATDKVPLHFVSGIVKAYAAIAHFLGNVKYGAWNYRAGGARASIYKAALDRHMDAWWEGEENDPVDGTPHLANALACINILIECSEGENLVDDRPPSRATVLRTVYAKVEALMPKIREKYSDRKPKHFTREDVV